MGGTPKHVIPFSSSAAAIRGETTAPRVFTDINISAGGGGEGIYWSPKTLALPSREGRVGVCRHS